MTMPTAAQIEADLALPTFQVQLHDGTSYVDVSSDVVEVAGEYRVTTGPDDGIGFGIAVTPSQTVRIAREAFARSWDRRAIRISLGFAGTNPLHFVGLVEGRDRDGPAGSWEATGYHTLIQAVPEIRSPLLYRRPAFTATTATSNEDPDDSGWAAGLGNLVLWRAGGRPLEQSATYPSPAFYYSCETSILAPEWSWLDGGDGAKCLDELCVAAGGVVYQDTAGVVRYVEPFSFAAGTPTITYTDAASARTAAARVAGSLAQYGRISERARTRQRVIDVVSCTFTQRRLQGVQEIYSDRTPRLLEPGQALSGVTLDLELPCYRVDRVEAQAGTLRSARTVTSSELTISVTQRYAQRLVVTLTNTLSEPIGVYDLKAFGQPLVAGEAASASYGTPVGAYPRAYKVPDSVYVQSRSYAERLCWMYHDFYSVPRPVRTLEGCGFDPRRQLGEVVGVVSEDWGLTVTPHRIVGMRVSRTGVAMDLDVVDVSGLPTSADFFQIGQAFGAGAQLAY